MSSEAIPCNELAVRDPDVFLGQAAQAFLFAVGDEKRLNEMNWFLTLSVCAELDATGRDWTAESFNSVRTACLERAGYSYPVPQLSDAGLMGQLRIAHSKAMPRHRSSPNVDELGILAMLQTGEYYFLPG